MLVKLQGDTGHRSQEPPNNTSLTFTKVPGRASEPRRKCDGYPPHLTLQEEEDGGFEEGGVQALAASPLGHAVVFRVPMTEEPLERHNTGSQSEHCLQRDTTQTANQKTAFRETQDRQPIRKLLPH